MAQINVLVGDIAGNTRQVIDWCRQARDELGADVVVFPELTLTGYPPEDLLLRPGLHARVETAAGELRQSIRDITAVVGLPLAEDGRLFNACMCVGDGEVKALYRKRILPNYGVFDEARYFQPGEGPVVVELGGIPCGLTICEDVWQPEPCREAAAAGARLILNLNASPFHAGKREERHAIVAARARENGLGVVYTNLVGGQDELVFDGHSFVTDGHGEVIYQAPGWHTGLHSIEVAPDGRPLPPAEGSGDGPVPIEEDLYSALVLGVRDYVTKNGFLGAVVGLSGGIDSALTLAIAADALGPDQVDAVLMPSRYTADMSIADAVAEAENLGVAHRIIPIDKPFQCFLDTLAQSLAGTAPDTTEENIQARCRGVLLMALSNKFRRMVLSTGNKSEMAVGYATLYGDMAGGFAPLKDVPKMMVYRLAGWRNRDGEVIPRRVLERPPSAELAPDQKDEDSLPPYPVLDAIIELYVERDLGREDIVAQGYDGALVDRIIGLIIGNEYKRRQAAPGIRITPRAFGRDRRYPITSGYR